MGSIAIPSSGGGGNDSGYRLTRTNYGGRITQTRTCQIPGEMVIVCCEDSHSGAITSTSVTGTGKILVNGAGSPSYNIDGAYISIVFLKSVGDKAIIVQRSDSSSAYTSGKMFVLSPKKYSPSNASLSSVSSLTIPTNSLLVLWSSGSMNNLYLDDEENGNIIVSSGRIGNSSYPSYLTVISAGKLPVTVSGVSANYKLLIALS